MPGAAAAVAAVVVKSVASFSLANFLVGTAISLALNAAATSLFGKKPKTPEIQTIKRDRLEVVRSSIAERRIVYGQAKVGGTMVFAESTGSKNKYLHLVVVVAAHEVEEIGDVYLNDELVGSLDGSGNVTSGKYAGKVRIKKHLGSSNQAADSDLVSEVPNWTNDHRLRGLAYVYYRLQHSTKTFPAGIPKPTVIVKGKKVYDPRSTTTVWSDNWALCVRDYYLTSEEDGGIGADSDEVNEDSFIAAANVSDETVATSSGTQKRYTLNGVVFTDQIPSEIIEDMMTAGAGAPVYTKGEYHIYAGAYRTPTVELTPDDVVGEFKVTPRLPRQELFNRVKGTFINKNDFWQSADFPPVENATYETQDNNERITRDIELAYTTDIKMAQRLAKIHLEKSRQAISVDGVFNYKALQVAVMETAMMTFPDLGWSQKVFICIGWVFDFASGIRLTLQEEAAAVYNWSGGDETVIDPAPNTNLPDPSVVEPPTGLTAESGNDQLFISGDGTVQTRIRVSWEDPDDTFAIAYLLRHKKDGESDFTSLEIPVGSNEHYISPVKDGESYTIELAVRNIRQVESDFTTLGHVVTGKTDLPPDVVSFNVSRMPDGTRRFTWNQSGQPVDVTVGGGFKIRYSNGSFDWDTATALHEGLLSVSPFETNELAAGTYTFGIKSVDSSGNESSNATLITTTLGNPRLREALYFRLEKDLNWPGTTTDCFVSHENILEAVSDGDWTDLPSTWDALASSWQTLLTRKTPIIYETPEIDLGAELDFNPLVTVLGDGTATIEFKTGTDSDGGVTGSYAAIDKVTGKRYVQFKITMAGTDPVIRDLNIILDGESLIDEFNDINVATESAVWFSRVAAGHFKVGTRKDISVITQARISALQNVGQGYTWELISKSQTVNSKPAAEFKVYNSSGVLTDATVDIEIKGPKASS